MFPQFTAPVLPVMPIMAQEPPRLSRLEQARILLEDAGAAHLIELGCDKYMAEDALGLDDPEPITAFQQTILAKFSHTVASRMCLFPLSAIATAER